MLIYPPLMKRMFNINVSVSFSRVKVQIVVDIVALTSVMFFLCSQLMISTEGENNNHNNIIFFIRFEQQFNEKS